MPLSAQNQSKNAHVFVRVYNMQGKKVAKGNLSAISENGLQLSRKDAISEFPLSSLGRIKTYRSAGNSIVFGAATGAVVFAVAGAASADPDVPFFGYTAGDGAAGGAVLGTLLGAGFGAAALAFDRSETFEINGDPEKWNAFRDWTLGD